MGMTAALRHGHVSDEKKEIIRRVEKDGDLFRARGNLWRRVGQKDNFWVCDLVLEGYSFSDKPRKVFMLPALEDIEPVSGCIFSLPQYPDEHSAPTQTAESKCVDVSHLLGTSGGGFVADTRRTEALLAAARSAAIEFKPYQYEPLLRILESPFPRLLIGDDVGLGKTTEAGLVASHMVQNGQAERILVICPAHLGPKWQFEMRSRFSLPFEIFDKRTRQRLSRSGFRNPWSAHEFVVVSMDFAKRWENLRPLRNVDWDLVIVDEAHHFIRAAHGLTNPRLRQLAEEVCIRSPGLLLLSATPFRGGLDEYESLLALLDPLTLERDNKGELTDAARTRRNEVFVRRLKKDVGGASEFPERVVRHIEATEHMGAEEKALVTQVAAFLRENTSRLVEKGGHLALEVLKKRASSSWLAFVETLEKMRLEHPSLVVPDGLAERARSLQERFEDCKSKSLTEFLKKVVIERNEKLVIFTEFIPSLDHICTLLRKRFPKVSFGAISGTDCFAWFEGQEVRENIDRSAIEDAFAAQDNPLRVLICTDAMSEGVDFQHACHCLLHYELPWSLVRLEQRNGRIDRLLQRKQPEIYNLILDTAATPDQRILQKINDRIEVWRKEIGTISELVEVIDSRDLNDSLLAGRDDILSQETLTQARKSAQTVAKETDSHQAHRLPFAEADLTRKTPQHLALVQFLLRQVLETEGGFLRATREANTFQLALPAGWELQGLERTFGYPSSDTPWFVTFDPNMYRTSEERARKELAELGTVSEKLHFLGGAHPIVTTALRRFRNRLYAQGRIPVLVANSGMTDDHALIYEATVSSRGEKSTVLWRDLDIVRPGGTRLSREALEALAAGLRSPGKADRLQRRMPGKRNWEALVEQGLHNAKEQAKDFLASNQRFRTNLAQEAARQEKVVQAIGKSSSYQKFVAELAGSRKEWIDELWEPLLDPQTGEPLVRFLPVCLVLKSDGRNS